MKLKIGSLTIEQETLWKSTLLLFVQGILISLMVAAKQDGYNVMMPFIIANVILIPAIAQRMFRDKKPGNRL